VALADAADGRVATHLPERFDVVREHQRRAAHPRGSQRRFRAGMASTNYDDVKKFWDGAWPILRVLRNATTRDAVDCRPAGFRPTAALK
jgi:hypothetical protein